MYVDVLKRDVFFDLFYLFSIILYIFANSHWQNQSFVFVDIIILFCSAVF